MVKTLGYSAVKKSRIFVMTLKTSLEEHERKNCWKLTLYSFDVSDTFSSKLFWFQSVNVGGYQFSHLDTYFGSIFQFHVSLLELFLSSADSYQFHEKNWRILFYCRTSSKENYFSGFTIFFCEQFSATFDSPSLQWSM